MIIKSPAIVIHSLRYSEADLIVSLFTKTNGLRSYLLRGVLKSRRGKIRASLFQPLTLLEIEAFHKDKGSLERIKEAKIKTTYKTLHTNFVKSSLVFFISEVLKNSIHEEEANVDLFEYLETVLIWLDEHETIGNFHIVFLIKLTQYLGFYPDIPIAKANYFNMLEGVFQSSSNNAYCIDGQHIAQFKFFLGKTFEASMYIKLSKAIRRDLLAMLLVYFELHLHGFKKPKSLSVLNEIFN
ncbi:DNA repair protein RecO [Aquimarina muelleri]|uniref:DNA repair protein RecO n=1 Tax=Aquimarina muelleri TaxID=279356 RepID=A0A918JTW1_9FLAO|nr:DNA repair protein RecO [Aquimarina muelleri]MCX2762792.1 DNA repair protein RecO [Aquimarina muelleri]GGX11924.1 DNA repair protein RecO [Aquimarina muelleri]